MQANNLISLDVGEKRIGVAVSHAGVRLAHALVTLQNGENIMDEIKQIIAKNDVGVVVVGLPRGLDGQDTQQTEYVRKFARRLEVAVGMAPKFQDEALTSRKAEAELGSRGKPYAKGDIDTLAATYILEDYISEHLVQREV